MSVQIELELQTEEAAQEVAMLEAQLRKLRDVSPDGEAFKSFAADLAKARAEAEKLQGKLQARSEAKSLFLQGVGGEELPERFGKISRAFTVAADSGASMGQRAMGMAGGLSLAASAAKVLGNNVLGMAQSFMEANEEATAHYRAIASLGPAYEQAQAAAHGLLTAEEALATRESLADAGFLGADSGNLKGVEALGTQIGQLSLSMHNFAQITGRDAAQAQQQFISAVQSGNAQALLPFGIALSKGASESHNMSEAIRQLTENFGGQDRYQRTVSDGLRQWGRDLMDAGRWIVTFGGASAGATAEIERQRHSLEQVRQEAARLSNAVAKGAVAEEAAAATKEAYAEAGKEVASAYATEAELLREATSGTIAVGASWEDLQGKADAASAPIEELSNDALRLADAMRDAAKARGQLSIALNEGENEGQALERIATAARQAIQVNEENRRRGVAVIRDLRAQGFNNTQIRGVQGLSQFMESASGSNHAAEALRRAKQAAAEAEVALSNAGLSLQDVLHTSGETLERTAEIGQRIIEMQQAGLNVAQFQRAAHETSLQYWRRITPAMTEAAASLTAYNEKLNEQVRLENALTQTRQENEALKADAAARVGESAFAAEREGLVGNERAFRESEDAHQAARNQAAELGDMGRQFGSAFGQLSQVTQTGAQAMAGTFANAFGTMTGALRSHIQAVIEGKETIGEAMRAIAHETLLSLASEAAVQAIMQTAMGLGKLAASWGADPTAYGHLASAAMFAVVAGAAGIGAAVTAPPAAVTAASGAGSGAGGPPRAASAVPPSSNGDAMRPVYNISFQGGIYHRPEQMGAEMARLLNDQHTRDPGSMRFARGAR